MDNNTIKNQEYSFCDPKFAELLKKRFGKEEVLKVVVEYLGGDPDKYMEAEEFIKVCEDYNIEFPEDLKTKIRILYGKQKISSTV